MTTTKIKLKKNWEMKKNKLCQINRTVTIKNVKISFFSLKRSYKFWSQSVGFLHNSVRKVTLSRSIGNNPNLPFPINALRKLVEWVENAYTHIYLYLSHTRVSLQIVSEMRNVQSATWKVHFDSPDSDYPDGVRSEKKRTVARSIRSMDESFTCFLRHPHVQV